VHAQLYAQSDPGHVDLRGLLHRLVEELRTGLLDDSARIEATLEPVEVESSQAAALVLIASELLTNAIKHGRPVRGQSRIAVGLRQRGLEAELSVTDNGPGCDPQDTQGRLGTQLMQALAQQLGAGLERSDQRPGCRVVLRFEPDRPRAAGAAA
jgi:two-component sensor histidine kinase